jgi:NAD+-dependent protein deacetylase sirtuin 5
MSRCRDLVHRKDQFLVIELYFPHLYQVFPAAGYAHEVKENGGKVAIFNIERSNGDEEADFLFLGPCEKALPEALWGSQSDES